MVTWSRPRVTYSARRFHTVVNPEWSLIVRDRLRHIHERGHGDCLRGGLGRHRGCVSLHVEAGRCQSRVCACGRGLTSWVGSMEKLPELRLRSALGAGSDGAPAPRTGPAPGDRRTSAPVLTDSARHGAGPDWPEHPEGQGRRLRRGVRGLGCWHTGILRRWGSPHVHVALRPVRTGGRMTDVTGAEGRGLRQWWRFLLSGLKKIWGAAPPHHPGILGLRSGSSEVTTREHHFSQGDGMVCDAHVESSGQNRTNRKGRGCPV